MTRLKDVAILNREALPESTEAGRTFTYVDIGSVDNIGKITEAEELRFEAAPSRARRLVRPGDSIVSTVRTYLRAIAYIDQNADDVVVSTGFATVTPRPGVHPRFLFWTIRSGAFIEEVVARSVGVSYPAITATELGTLSTPLPPPEDQRRIADFLDAETARIDDLIAEQERQRGLVEERFHAYLVTAVTLGIRSQSTFPSDELGGLPIPKTWEVRRLGTLECDIQTGPFGSQLHQADYIDDGYPVVNPANLIGGRITPTPGMSVDAEARDRLSRHVLKDGDVVFGRRGEMGRAGLVTAQEAGWLCGTGSLRIRFRTPVFHSSYLKRVLEASIVKQYLEAESVGSTMDNLNTSIVARIPVPVPPLDEQVEISQDIDRQQHQVNLLSAELLRSIELLREHREAVIASAVAGDPHTLRGVA